MRIVALDDEKLALTLLKKSIEGAIPDGEITDFTQPLAALEFISENKTDAVFCDYQMPGMNGIDFAKRVKQQSPKTDIVFVTGYDEYAPAAINAVCPQGYITKPVSKKKIQEVLCNLHMETEGVKKGLYIQTFGRFNVWYNGAPVEFKVKKSLELLAYLIHSGGGCPRRELTAVLHEDKEERNAVRYLAEAVKCLSATLGEIGCGDILIRKFNSYGVDSTRFSCDLYEYLKGNINLYRGEYMTQYEWAEFYTGRSESLKNMRSISAY